MCQVQALPCMKFAGFHVLFTLVLSLGACALHDNHEDSAFVLISDLSQKYTGRNSGLHLLGEDKNDAAWGRLPSYSAGDEGVAASLFRDPNSNAWKQFEDTPTIAQHSQNTQIPHRPLLGPLTRLPLSRSIDTR